MVAQADPAAPAESDNPGRLGLLLSAAMFVLVVDTSLMNVSISAIVADLGTTVSGVQSAIALEALVSAAFILISSKLGDLFGRKLAYTVGLLGYAIGATAMVFANSLLPVIIFWAILGGLGRLPVAAGHAVADPRQLRGRRPAPGLCPGRRVGGHRRRRWTPGRWLHHDRLVVAHRLRGRGGDHRRRADRAGHGQGRQVHRRTEHRPGWRRLSVFGMGGVVLGILVWQEGGEAVGALLAIGFVSMALLAWWLVRRKRHGDVPLIDPGLFSSKQFRLGISGQLMQQIALGGMMIALPIFLQMVLQYSALLAGLSLAPLSLSMFAIATLAGRRAGNRRPALIIRLGFVLLVIGVALLIPLVPRIDSGWWMALPLAIAGSGLGLLVSQLNNYTLGPIEEERISEAAGVNSAGGSFGLSFGLALGGSLMLISLAFNFTAMTNDSAVLPPDDKEQIAAVLEEDAEIMSDAALEAQLAGEPEAIQAEVIRINDEARSRALQVALLVPLLAGLIGLVNSFRMVGLPDIKPKADIEGYSLGG